MNSENIKNITNQAIEQLIEALKAGKSEAFSTSPPHLFPLKPLQRPSSPRFFGSRQLWPRPCKGPCSAAQPRYSLILALSPIELA